MARTGRPPKPTHLKLLEGTFRPDRANRAEPRAAAGTPTCPPELGARAKAEWKRIIPELRKMGILSRADRATIAAYCQAYARWLECEELVTALGMTFMTEKGYVCQRPEVALAAKFSKLTKEYAGALGLHPQGRSAVRVDAKDKPTKDPAQDFLFGDGNGKKARKAQA